MSNCASYNARFIDPSEGDPVVIACYCQKCLFEKREVNILTGLTVSQVVLCVHGDLSQVLIDNRKGSLVPFAPDGKCLDETLSGHEFVALPDTKQNRKTLYNIGVEKYKQARKAAS